MNIVVVDGATLNPGDLSWEPLSEFGVYNVHPHSTPAETLARCRDAEAVLTNKAEFGRDSIVALPKLKYIGVTATGYNIVDVAAAVERGIVVTNVPTYGTASVAQADLAAALNSGSIAGAGLDVLSVEPPQPDNPLVTASNCVITPHIAWATRSARQRLLQTSIDNLASYAAGTSRNVVNHWT